jgi:hypothetical protein
MHSSEIQFIESENPPFNKVNSLKDSYSELFSFIVEIKTKGNSYSFLKLSISNIEFAL